MPTGSIVSNEPTDISKPIGPNGLNAPRELVGLNWSNGPLGPIGVDWPIVLIMPPGSIAPDGPNGGNGPAGRAGFIELCVPKWAHWARRPRGAMRRVGPTSSRHAQSTRWAQ